MKSATGVRNFVLGPAALALLGSSAANVAAADKLPDPGMPAGNNSGGFPFDRVHQVIAGRQELKAHGSRKMRIGGHAFCLQSSGSFENYPAGDPESSARSRILALDEHAYRLQGK
jgi:hypothetical protein